MHLKFEKTLDYFLSDKGISNFPLWYHNLTILESIHDDLDNYVSMLKATRWLDDKSRSNIRTFISEYLELFINLTYKKTAKELFQVWIESIKQYCFQGGYGYAIYYPNAPHHWVIKPEYYNKVVPIPEHVILATCVCNQYIEIAKTAEQEYWK